jgi:hypothetical protein
MWRSLARGYTALEFGFAAQAFEIAPNDRHRELPVASSVGDLAVARFQMSSISTWSNRSAWPT